MSDSTSRDQPANLTRASMLLVGVGEDRVAQVAVIEQEEFGRRSGSTRGSARSR